ncbi:cytochrome c [Lacibacter sp.]|uniref:c-type cytochrome n=1 Tax=Lacibacter sp. TaxID=1915409 RepID=UPI002B4B001F|nr:cytochrome c [Lacibacter sp.]HLP36319.1 cytochrome c [Lacibacter sp.]
MKYIVTASMFFLFSSFNLKAQQNGAIVKKMSLKRGQIVYNKYCMVCHQKDGGGVQNLNPPLINSKYVSGNKMQLINIVLKGMNEPVEIDGDTYSNPMPAQAFLTNEQIADVLTFIRNNFENKASVVTVQEVKMQRSKK